MALIDTTNVVHTAMSQKAQLDQNWDVKDNYYLRSLQNKINAEWTYRNNRVTIEQEVGREEFYSTEPKKWEEIESVIQNVYDSKNQKMSDDYKKLVFKNIQPIQNLGRKFRFAFDFQKFAEASDEERHWMSSVWIATNNNLTYPTNSVLARRCNTNIGFIGTATGRVSDNPEDKILEYHFEPAIFESVVQRISNFFNINENLAQADVFLIIQYNYYTRNISVDDRVVMGDINYNAREKSDVYRVKNVMKFAGLTTFQINKPDNKFADIPIIVVGLDKDEVAAGDGLTQGEPNFRIATHAPIYKVSDDPYVPEPVDEFIIQPITTIPSVVYIDNPITFELGIFKNGILQTGPEFDIQVDSALDTANPDLFYKLEKQDLGLFELSCLRSYLASNLQLTFTWVDLEGRTYELKSEIQLSGW